MRPPRYRIRVQTTDAGITEQFARTRKEASNLFSLAMGWDHAKNGVYNGCPENHLYVEMEDSGQERGEFRCIEYVYLHEELEEAAKSGSRELLDTTLQRLIEEWRERQPPQVERKV